MEKCYGRHIRLKGKQALKTRRKVQHERGYQLDSTCYPGHTLCIFMHEVPGTQLLRPTVVERCISWKYRTKVQNVFSIVSGRDASADEVGSAVLPALNYYGGS